MQEASEAMQEASGAMQEASKATQEASVPMAVEPSSADTSQAVGIAKAGDASLRKTVGYLPIAKR
jgi:hypothetical protein